MLKSLLADKLSFDIISRSWHLLPEYLLRKGYRNPSDSCDCAMSMAFPGEGTVFNVIAKRQDDRERFDSYMTGQRRDRANWLDFYPLK